MPRTKRKKTRTHVVEDGNNNNSNSTNTNNKTALKDGTGRNSNDTTNRKIPKSLIIRKGKTSIEVEDLVSDLRYMMMPYTALQFQENTSNRKITLSHYNKHLALPMGISHILAFTQNNSNPNNPDGSTTNTSSNSNNNGDYLNLTIVRTPDGPTLQFRVVQFSLSKHIRAIQKRPMNNAASVYSNNPPIVVTNNFGNHTASSHIKLLRITFQNMFPQINISTIPLKDCRRVVLFNLITKTTVDNTKAKEGDKNDDNSKTKTNTNTKQYVEIRHYAIRATPVGVNKRIRRLVQSKIPNLNKCQDIADYLNGSNSVVSDAPSDSEAEDDPTNSTVVQLSDKYVGKGNNKLQTSSLKLIEIGPRICIELIKVQKNFCTGDILYHSYISKSLSDVMEIKQRIVSKEKLKEQRKQLQNDNILRKKQKLNNNNSTNSNKQERNTNTNDDDDNDDNDENDGDINDDDNDDGNNNDDDDDNNNVNDDDE